MQRDARILVVGPSWIGDTVMSQCLFKALKGRDPDIAIDVLAPPGMGPVLSRMPEVDAVLPSPFGHRNFHLAKRIGVGRTLVGRYAAAYVLPGSWKSAIIPYVARVPRRIGYLREARWGLLNDIRPLPSAIKRKTAIAYQALAEPEVAADRSRLAVPALRVDMDNRDHLLGIDGLSEGAFAAFFPGAEYGPAKRWPARHWSALAGRLDRLGLRVVLFGSPKDRDFGQEIVTAQSSILDLTGRTSIKDAIDLISAARFAVTNDSGLMHVAAAVGRKLVAIYGSTSPNDTPALSDATAFLSLGLPCSPCFKRTCPLGHFDCLEKLEPAMAMRAIETLGAI